MPKLTAPDDLLPLATPLHQRLAPAWTVEIVRVPRVSIGGSDGRTSANTTTSEARIQIADDLTGEALRKTVGHEMAHVNGWPVTSLLDHTDPRTLEIIEPMIERFGLAAVASALARKTTPAALNREGEEMDLPIMLAALTAIASAADVGAALTSFIAELKSLVPADAEAPKPEDTAGTPVEVMRRALARKATPVDTTGEKLRSLFGAKSTDEALALARADMLDATRLRATTQERTVADLAAERKALLVDAISKLGCERKAFLDGDNPAIGYREQDMTIEGLRAFVGRLGGPVARTSTALARAGDGDDAALAERARKSGMTVDARREAEANVNRGCAAERI